MDSFDWYDSEFWEISSDEEEGRIAPNRCELEVEFEPEFSTDTASIKSGCSSLRFVDTIRLEGHTIDQDAIRPVLEGLQAASLAELRHLQAESFYGLYASATTAQLFGPILAQASGLLSLGMASGATKACEQADEIERNLAGGLAACRLLHPASQPHRLELSTRGTHQSVSIAKAVGQLPRLDEVKLSGYDSCSPAVAAMISAPTCSIRRLVGDQVFDSTESDAPVWRAVASNRSLRSLKWVYPSAADVEAIAAFGDAIARNTGLRELRLLAPRKASRPLRYGSCCEALLSAMRETPAARLALLEIGEWLDSRDYKFLPELIAFGRIDCVYLRSKSRISGILGAIASRSSVLRAIELGSVCRFGVNSATLSNDDIITLGRALEHNDKLVSFDGECPHLQYSGTAALAQGLAKNRRLEILRIGGVTLTNQGQTALLRALVHNDTLVHLSIEGSRTGHPDPAVFAQMLSTNRSLQRFHSIGWDVQCNTFSSASRTLMAALARNYGIRRITIALEGSRMSFDMVPPFVSNTSTLRDLRISDDSGLLVGSLPSCLSYLCAVAGLCNTQLSSIDFNLADLEIDTDNEESGSDDRFELDDTYVVGTVYEKRIQGLNELIEDCNAPVKTQHVVSALCTKQERNKEYIIEATVNEAAAYRRVSQLLPKAYARDACLMLGQLVPSYFHGYCRLNVWRRMAKLLDSSGIYRAALTLLTGHLNSVRGTRGGKWVGAVQRCKRICEAVSWRRRGYLAEWRRAYAAKRDAARVFQAASQGRPLELAKRLRLGHLAGGAEAQGLVNREGKQVQLSALEAAEVGGHEKCVQVLQSYLGYA